MVAGAVELAYRDAWFAASCGHRALCRALQSYPSREEWQKSSHASMQMPRALDLHRYARDAQKLAEMQPASVM